MNKPTTPPRIALELTSIKKSFQQGDETLDVLKDVSLGLEAGTCTALVGSSGSGKSTLLHIAGLLDKPTEGQIKLDGHDVSDLKDSKLALFRRHRIGFVYQFHHLLPEFTALENVMLPLTIQGVSYGQAREKAESLLTSLNLMHRAAHRPTKLSGGEQQRIAILRALVTEPDILLADEPTGNLDVDTSQHVFAELMSLIKSHNIAALIATHDPDLAQKMDRTLYLDHGSLKSASA